MLNWLKVIASGAVGIGGLIVALVSPNTTVPSVEIQTIGSSCAVGVAEGTEAKVSGNSIVITAPFDTPDPCHRVTGSVSVVGNRIIGSLSVISMNSTCIQCVGRVVGQVTISHLQPGVYTLEIDRPDGQFNATVEVL